MKGSLLVKLGVGKAASALAALAAGARVQVVVLHEHGLLDLREAADVAHGRGWVDRADVLHVFHGSVPGARGQGGATVTARRKMIN